MPAIKPLDAMPEVLKKFTGDGLRYDLATPWPDRGWWYATNGRVLVGARVRGAKRGLQHKPGEKGVEGSRCVPEVRALLSDGKKGKWRPWPGSPESRKHQYLGLGFCVNRRWLTQYYYDLVAALPGVEYLVNRKDRNAALQFRWAHGVGAVMGLIGG